MSCDAKKTNLHLLDTVPLFSKLTTRDREAMIMELKERVYHTGDILMNQGDMSSAFFIVQQGMVLITKQSVDRGREDVEIIKEGGYFGEANFLKPVKNAASAVAKTEVRALVLEREKFTQIVGAKRLDVKFGKRIAINSDNIGVGEETKVIAQNSGTNKVKSDQVRCFLIQSVSKNVLFKNLDEKQIHSIVDDMFRLEIPAETVVIRQGDTGDYFYAVESGLFDIFVSRGGAPPVNVNDPKVPGKCFGELALLYNAPRNATVVAKETSVLWAVERNSFRQIISRVSANKLAEYDAVIQTIPILTLLTDMERGRLADALELKSYAPQSVMIEQNAKNDTLYMIISGEAVASQSTIDEISGEAIMIEVARLKPGDFFGDKALIHDETVPAYVSALSSVQCVCLDRRSFIQIVGPIDNLIQRVTRIVKPKDPIPILEKRSVIKYDRKKDFEVIGILGVGSFAVVELVKEKKTGQTFALKSLSRASIKLPSQKQHVLNEKNVLASLDSPFLVKMFGTCKDDSALCFVLEPCLAGELFSLMQRQIHLPELSARFYCACVINAFEAMHKAGIIYRDLKPENLLLANNGYVKVADFGLAKLVLERTWTVCGTPDYLAPEVVCGQGHGKGVDWWTLGVFLFEMLTGEPPFFDEDVMQTYQKIINSTVSFPNYISSTAQSFISELLQPKVAKRLGCGHNGALDLKNHAWYAGFDWNALEKGKMVPPYIPTILHQEDLSNFEEILETSVDFPICTDNSGWDADF